LEDDKDETPAPAIPRTDRTRSGRGNSWGKVKAESNLQEHKVSFEDADEALDDPRAFIVEDIGHSIGCRRLTYLGRAHGQLSRVTVEVKMARTRKT